MNVYGYLCKDLSKITQTLYYSLVPHNELMAQAHSLKSSTAFDGPEFDSWLKENE